MSNFAVFLDTCVLYPPTLCDLILRIAERGAFGVRWSGDVLAELRRVLVRDGVDAALADRRIRAMEAAFPMSTVDGYYDLIPAMANDPGDRHVLAATVLSDAQVLVTFNLRHFPEASVAPFGLEVAHPDVFLLQQLDLHPGLVAAALRSQVADSRRPAWTEAQLLGRLSRIGLSDFADEVRRHL